MMVWLECFYIRGDLTEMERLELNTPLDDDASIPSLEVDECDAIRSLKITHLDDVYMEVSFATPIRRMIAQCAYVATAPFVSVMIGFALFQAMQECFSCFLRFQFSRLGVCMGEPITFATSRKTSRFASIVYVEKSTSRTTRIVRARRVAAESPHVVMLGNSCVFGLGQPLAVTKVSRQLRKACDRQKNLRLQYS
ncbi:hypothetical protein LGN21_15895 [Burkholderia cepacia]|uniref:hypothetical protein n=1 Tax=Burkholderia cepacia TaxID=292 RepID=UPI001CF46679|nr:hypothetical protein [Burkholderia cepacia]MCA8281068.1 hypothetical protein [Burkholderia cepacia]